MNKKILTLLLLITLGGATIFAQGRKGICINEVMAENDSKYVDDYGMRHAWIELFNSTYGTVQISTMYLTDDKSKAKEEYYTIPRADVNTKIPPRQHVVFWADGEPNKGTFHLSFKLKPGKTNTIYLIDSDGLTLIDSVAVPATLKAGQTYARKEDGVKAKGWEVRDGSNEKYITPSSNNVILDKNEKIEGFRDNDTTGSFMTVMAMLVVFSSLLLLCISFYLIGQLHAGRARKKKAVATGKEVAPSAASLDSGEEIAAICMALHEHLNMHDKEDFVLTINKVKRTYSPWSSKIYSLRETPKR